MKLLRQNKGFTLIELMVVVALVGVIFSVAVPSYREYAMRTKRAAATGDLMELSHIMERRFTALGRYDDEEDPGTFDLPYTASPRDDSHVAYNISFDALDSVSYIMQATPADGQADDTKCGIVSISHSGIKCVLDGAHCSDGDADDRSAVAQCW
jgi:type IV pilus assembly protein PilE